MTSFWRSEPASFTAAAQSFIPRVEAGAGAAARELPLAGIALVVRAEPRLAEGIADVLVVVEAAVEAFHMRRRQQAGQVLVEIAAAARRGSDNQRHGLARRTTP